LSALTKIFIVLLVVCSLLSSAAIVVFVNRQEEFRKLADAKEALLASEKLAAANARQDFTKEQQKTSELIKTINSNEAQAQDKLNAADQKSKEQALEIAKLGTDIATVKVDNANLVKTVEITDQSNKDYQAETNKLRQEVVSLADKNKDLNVAFTELKSQNDALENNSRRLQETLVATTAERDRALEAYKARFGASPEAAVTVAAPPVEIRGVVKSVETVENQKFATISVGSSDNVAKGMKFNVINTASGDFLGILTVISVQPTEAVGKIEGPEPKVSQIKPAPGVEVRTQL